MTWLLVLSLAAAAYLFKVTGLVIVGGRSLPPVVERCLALVPAALISALIVKDTVSVGDELVLDARLPGVLAAVVAARRSWDQSRQAGSTHDPRIAAADGREVHVARRHLPTGSPTPRRGRPVALPPW
ncbi:MAG: AzlD domain-containing protein [Ilumatobacteraceae bacterium]